MKRAIGLLSLLLTSALAATVVLNGTVVSIMNNQMVMTASNTTVVVKLPPKLAANVTSAIQVGSNVTVIGNMTNKGMVMAREIAVGNVTYAVMAMGANGTRAMVVPHLNGTAKMVMNQHRMRHQYRNNQTNTTTVAVEIQETTTTTTNPWNGWPSPSPMTPPGQCCNQATSSTGGTTHPTSPGGGTPHHRGR